MSDELVLAISGNDIFSGGGLHADLATFTTNKQNGFVAITCLTAVSYTHLTLPTILLV